MNRIVFTLGIWLFPAACTALGAAGVFLLRRQTRPTTRRILCGMAAGIMLAASVWSLLLPAIARSQGRAVWVPPALGLILGAVGLLRLEDAAGQLLAGGPGHCGRMVLAVTLHNLPEGMVVGLAAALALHGDADAVSGALALSLGIGLQNIPEGGGQSAADPERAHPGAVLCRRCGLRAGGALGRGAGLCAGRVGRRSAAMAHERRSGLYGVCDRTGDDP